MTLSFRGQDRKLNTGKEIVFWTKHAKEYRKLRDSQLVFVGYGIVAPEYNWNDYDVIAKNLDLGIPDTNLPIEELDLLITLAPSEIKKTATKIRNSSADVAEISALDQLFAATFDPEAIEAQNFFQTYNAQNCNIETEVVQDLVSEKQAETRNELELFLTSNYSEANWNDKTETIVIFNGIEIIGLNGKLPLGSGFQEADALCQALSLWLYAVKEIEGTINIQVGENEWTNWINN